MSRLGGRGLLLLLLSVNGCAEEGKRADRTDGGSAGNAATGGAAGSGGASSGGAVGTGGASGNDDGGVVGPAIVAVGYAGLRVVSYDLGRTWEQKQTLGSAAADDPTLLRAVTFGGGVFVAAGHRIFTSPDGADWTERTNPQAQWLGGVAYGSARFVAVGGYGYSAWSLDGSSWTEGGALGTEAARSLVFGNGTFMARTDPGNWWSSADGTAWSEDSGGHTEDIAFCNGAFQTVSACGPASGFGVFVRDGGWDSGVISRSTDGTTWEDVTVGFVGGVTGFAFGTVRH